MERRGFLQLLSLSPFVTWLSLKLPAEYAPKKEITLNDGPYVWIHGVDLSRHCSHLEIRTFQDAVECWGGQFVSGFKEARIYVTIDCEREILDALGWMHNDPVEMRYRCRYAPVSELNPEYSFKVLLLVSCNHHEELGQLVRSDLEFVCIE